MERHEFNKLAQFRDEVKLQAHLFKAEALDEWHRLEKKWERFTSEVDRLAEATDDSDENTGAFARTLLEELNEGYEGLKVILNDPLV